MGRVTNRRTHGSDANVVRCNHIAQILRGENYKLSSALLGVQSIRLELIKRDSSAHFIEEHVVFVHETEWRFDLRAKLNIQCI